MFDRKFHRSPSLAMPFRPQTKYQKLEDVTLHSKEHDLAASSEISRDDFSDSTETIRPVQRNPPWPWIISTIVFGTLSFVLSVYFLANLPRVYSYEKGYRTDLRPAIPLIETLQVQFSAALTFDDNGTLIREHAEGESEWVGTPTPEMDALWDPLALDAAGIYLDGEEADTVRGKTKYVDGYWISGLDVFHQIHCLNKLRKALSPEYYHDPDPPNVHRLHVEHCIDYLRQAILCSADMSEVHVLWFESAKRYAPDFKTVHTCRNVAPLLEWSLARSRREKSGSEEEITPHHEEKSSS